jgi:hypothetical protein
VPSWLQQLLMQGDAGTTTHAEPAYLVGGDRVEQQGEVEANDGRVGHCGKNNEGCSKGKWGRGLGCQQLRPLHAFYSCEAARLATQPMLGKEAPFEMGSALIQVQKVSPPRLSQTQQDIH